MTINIGGRQVPITDVADINLDQTEVIVDGVRLTEARAEELAREISRRHGRKGGRPIVGDARIAVRLPNATKERLDQIANHQGIREADAVREAIDEYLERRGA